MYPANYFSLFPSFPRRDTVFVAMSFEEQFKPRWLEVIEPAISNAPTTGNNLKPVRVDTRRISDSILTEILSGISESRLVFADVSTLRYAEGRPIRSENVLYEVGIAHAIRLGEEVLLFRSDNDRLLFDIANVRVNYYEPEKDPNKARSLIRDSIDAALRELDLRRHMAVSKAAESLDLPSWAILAEAQGGRMIRHPEMKTMGQALANASAETAIGRLLELGAIRTTYFDATPEKLTKLERGGKEIPVVAYECTEFGAEVFKEGLNRMGGLGPLIRERLEKDRAGRHGK